MKIDQEEEKSGPLPKKKVLFRSGKNGMDDLIQLKLISAN